MKRFIIMNGLLGTILGILILTMAMVSCSGEDPEPQLQGTSPGSSGKVQNYCVYYDLKICFLGSFEECPDGSDLKDECPEGFEGDIEQSSSSNAASETSSNSSDIELSETSSSSNVSLQSSNSGGGSGAGPVSYYGRLKASGNRLVGSKTGTAAVQVKGVSLFWSNTGWGGDRFFTASAVNAMVDDWKAEIVRVPLGYSNGDVCGECGGGYQCDASNLARVKTAINAAIAKDVYVIIDWHSHCANNESAAATAFFKEMAETYGKYDHVIFEIFNEPINQSWATIKSYAESIISTIRTNGGANSLILVGTPKYSVNPKAAIGNFLSDNNVAYVFHFYAAEHPTTGANWGDNNNTTYLSNVTAVLNAGKPIFVSEYGTVNADGNGAHNTTNSNNWHTFMNSNKISSCAWSVNDKAEGASFLTNGVSMSNLTNTSNMTSSGAYIYNMLRTWANSAVWRGNGGATSSSGAGGGQTTYCDFGPLTQYGGGCFEMADENDCDLEWGKVVDSCPSNSYCLDYGDNSCISTTKISSCSNWAYGVYEISNSCPSGWTIY